MTGRTHGAWGMIGGAGIACLSLSGRIPSTSWTIQLLGVLLAGLASLIPDLDTEESLLMTLPKSEGLRMARSVLRGGARSYRKKGGPIDTVVRLVIAVVLLLLGAILSGLVRVASFITRLFTKHREATHSLLALLIAALLSGLVGGIVAVTITALHVEGEIFSSILQAVSSPELRWQAVYVTLVFAVGWGTHLFLDLLTSRGIALFYPLYQERIHLLALRTGGGADKILCAFGNVLLGVLLLVYGIVLLQKQGWISEGVLSWWL